MKEGFDGSHIGVRITRRDQEIIHKLSTTMYPGLYLSMSDVARVLMREGMKNFGMPYPVDGDDEPAVPVREPQDPRKSQSRAKR